MRKSVFVQKDNKSLVRFKILITASFLLMLISLFLPLDQLSSAIADQFQGEKTYYPATPEGVVDAFVKAGLNSEKLEAQYKYLPDDEDLKANHQNPVIDTKEPWGPSINKLHIASGYDINDVTIGDNKASIRVLYKRLGWILDTPIHINECRSPQTTMDKDGCRFLHITNDSREMTYHLVKPTKFWRIIDVYEPHISISIAIKWLEEIIEYDRRRTSPSEEQKVEIRKNIETLANHLKNENRGDKP